MSIVLVMAQQAIGRREQDMGIRDSIVAPVALAISTLAMAGVVGSGAYAQAAGAEARGVHALSNAMAHTFCAHSAPAVTLALSSGVAP
jgi:hypothetical protein